MCIFKMIHIAIYNSASYKRAVFVCVSLNSHYCMCILVQVKLKYSILNLLIVESHSSRKKWYLSFTQRGWNSLLLKKLTSAILRVSWRGGWQHSNPPLPPLNPGRSPGQNWQCWLTELPVACPADFCRVTLQKWSSTPKDLRILGRGRVWSATSWTGCLCSQTSPVYCSGEHLGACRRWPSWCPFPGCPPVQVGRVGAYRDPPPAPWVSHVHLEAVL